MTPSVDVPSPLGGYEYLKCNFSTTIRLYTATNACTTLPVYTYEYGIGHGCQLLCFTDDGSRKTPGQKYPWLQDSDSSGSEETLAKGSLVSCPGGLKSGDETKLDPEVTAANPDEIVLSDSSDNSDLGMAGGMEVGAGTQIHAAGCQPNPDEIALSDSEDGSVDQSQTSGQTRGLPTPARGWGIPETVASVQGSESVPTAAAGSSAEKDSVMLQEQLRSDGSGDSRGSTALGRRPLLLPNPAHPGAPSSAGELISSKEGTV